MSFPIYKLVEAACLNNTYNTSRESTLQTVFVKNCNTMQEAQDFIVKMNLSERSYELGLQRALLDRDYDKIRNRILLEDRHYCQLRYFIGKPDIKKMMEQLRADGVNTSFA